MLKKPKNSRNIVLVHSLGIFGLVLFWILAIFFKDSLGTLKIPVFIGLVLITLLDLYLFNRLLMKNFTNKTTNDDNKNA